MFLKGLPHARHSVCHSHPSFIIPVPQVTRRQLGEGMCLARSQQVEELRFGPGPLLSSPQLDPCRPVHA